MGNSTATTSYLGWSYAINLRAIMLCIVLQNKFSVYKLVSFKIIGIRAYFRKSAI